MENNNVEFLKSSEITGIMDAASQGVTEDMEKKLENLAVAQQYTNVNNVMPFRKPIQQVREYKIHRNDPCPCGSGKKYKNCCLNTGDYEKFTDA